MSEGWQRCGSLCFQVPEKTIAELVKETVEGVNMEEFFKTSQEKQLDDGSEFKVR